MFVIIIDEKDLDFVIVIDKKVLKVFNFTNFYMIFSIFGFRYLIWIIDISRQKRVKFSIK